MNFKEYSQEALKTKKYPDQHALNYLIPGLCSEVGEVAGIYKRLVRRDYASSTGLDGFSTFIEKVIPELGDTLWYITLICYELGIELEDVAKYNVDKLREREKRGSIKGEGDIR